MNAYNDDIYINEKKNNKKYYRKRDIPFKKTKKYPTKPKTNKEDDIKYDKYMKSN